MYKKPVGRNIYIYIYVKLTQYSQFFLLHKYNFYIFSNCITLV